MSRSLCQRCSTYSSCCLNYDGKACQKERDVEPTNFDKINDMDEQQLAAFLSDWAEDQKAWKGDEGMVEAWLQDKPDWRTGK